MAKSSKANVRIVPVFRKANLTDIEFLQEILTRVIVASKAYVAKNDKRQLEPKKEEGEEGEEGEMVNVRYVSRGYFFTDDVGSSVAAEISLC
jgi:hypothetical protein